MGLDRTEASDAVLIHQSVLLKDPRVLLPAFDEDRPMPHVFEPERLPLAVAVREAIRLLIPIDPIPHLLRPHPGSARRTLIEIVPAFGETLPMPSVIGESAAAMLFAAEVFDSGFTD